MRWAADGADQRTKEAYYPRVSKADLVPQGYVAERSGHSRGSTVDVTLARPCGEHVVALDMGHVIRLLRSAPRTTTGRT
jgi:D-alanyl-D-alanine dipeptidase